MAYGTNVPDNFRGAAGYVHRILKGENPADLPISGAGQDRARRESEDTDEVIE
jgi:ABC-type uncharacterized transport system substrate-binding protein